MKTIDDLRTALDYRSPTVRPDIAAIIARGRRRTAVSRLAAGGAALAVAALTAVGVTVALGTGPVPANTGPTNTGPVSRGSGGSTVADAAPNAILVAAVSAAPPTDAPTRFDPTVRTLHVGTIPPGLPEQSAETGPFQQSYAATTTAGAAGPGVVVIILPRGLSADRLPSGQLGMPLDASSVVAGATAPINGRPARCLRDPAVAGSCTVLLWQYAPGAWARASYAAPAGTSVADANAATRRMAESVRLSAGDPVRLPYRLTGPLAGLRIAGTNVSVDDRSTASPPVWHAQVSLVDNEADFTGQAGVRPELTVDFSRIDPRADPGHTANQLPNTTVDGHRAWLDTDGRSLVVHLADDPLRVYLGYFQRPGSALAAYRGVSRVPTPDDLRTWVPV